MIVYLVFFKSWTPEFLGAFSTRQKAEEFVSHKAMGVRLEESEYEVREVEVDA